jgi:hypothetical protein
MITPPDLETPSYDVLVLKNNYELRRYQPFTLAATSMGPGAGGNHSDNQLEL